MLLPHTHSHMASRCLVKFKTNFMTLWTFTFNVMCVDTERINLNFIKSKLKRHTMDSYVCIYVCVRSGWAFKIKVGK